MQGAMVVTPLYAALLALWFVVLSLHVIRCRREARVSLGDGGNGRLQRAIRAQANFAEYVPLALVLLPAFVMYMNRFQIAPEERALTAMFGAEFGAYRQEVRRWL